MVLVETPFPANGTADCACTDDAATVETPSRARSDERAMHLVTPYK